MRTRPRPEPGSRAGLRAYSAWIARSGAGLTSMSLGLGPPVCCQLPAALSEDKWPEGFKALPVPEKVLLYSEDDAAALRDTAIEAWRSALSR